MKKITISIALLASVLTLKAQDTTCTYFSGENVYEFDYKMDTILSIQKQTTKYYGINIKSGSVLCLDLSDKKKRVRRVIITYSDGEIVEQVIDSKDKVYYSPKDAVKVLVGKPKLAIKL